MQPLILSGGSSSTRQDYIIQNFNPSEWLITHLHSLKPSISIKEIHLLITDLAVTPMKQRLVWIEEANILTLPAQNALLKTLEEPPLSTQFILSLSNPAQLLETIRSRCLSISLTSLDPVLDSESLQIIKLALTSNPGKRLSLATTLPTKRPEAGDWITKLISSLASTARNTTSPKQLAILSSITSLALTAQLQLKQNCNVPLTLQNLFLKLPKAK